MERKKILWRVLILAAVVFLTIPLQSFAGVAGSKHDFTVSGTSQFSGNFAGDNDEVCVYCHTPHGALGSQTPLWNKALSFPNGFTMYSSSTMDATVPGTPSTISLLCLSCHDGIGAINAVLNAPGPTGSITVVFGDDQIGDLGPLGSRVNIGNGDPASPGPVDLSDDHPVSITWPTGDTGLYAAPQDPSLRLFNGKVECATCHDPHNGTPIDTGGNQFMVMSNQGSQMCLSCHIK